MLFIKKAETPSCKQHSPDLLRGLDESGGLGLFTSPQTRWSKIIDSMMAVDWKDAL
jgi:hypothetical protein